MASSRKGDMAAIKPTRTRKRHKTADHITAEQIEHPIFTVSTDAHDEVVMNRYISS